MLFNFVFFFLCLFWPFVSRESGIFKQRLGLFSVSSLMSFGMLGVYGARLTASSILVCFLNLRTNSMQNKYMVSRACMHVVILLNFRQYLLFCGHYILNK